MTTSHPVTARLLQVQAERLGLRLHAVHGGLDREIRQASVVHPARAPGQPPADVDGAIVVVGATDVEWLLVRPVAEQDVAPRDRVTDVVPAVIVCGGLFPPPSLAERAEATGVPVFLTRRPASELSRDLEALLAPALAAREIVHGELVQVHNLGVLIVGESGIGKSEAALELVLRGHRLVADDVVDLERAGPVLLGKGREGLSHYLEVRGLGVLHAADLFGQAAVLEKTAVHLVVELVEWSDSVSLDRTGLDQLNWTALGVEVPLVRLLVRPGRNVALLIEVAARNQILKRRGIHSARRLDEELLRRLEPEDETTG